MKIPAAVLSQSAAKRSDVRVLKLGPEGGIFLVISRNGGTGCRDVGAAIRMNSSVLYAPPESICFQEYLFGGPVGPSSFAEHCHV